MDTIVDKWFSTRDQKITWGISLAFFIIFPVYFANIAAFLPGDAMIDSSDSATGAWDVDFTETDVSTSESTEFLMDGEEFEFEFTKDGSTIIITKLPELVVMFEELFLRISVLKNHPNIANELQRLLEIERIIKHVIELINEWAEF